MWVIYLFDLVVVTDKMDEYFCEKTAATSCCSFVYLFSTYMMMSVVQEGLPDVQPRLIRMRSIPLIVAIYCHTIPSVYLQQYIAEGRHFGTQSSFITCSPPGRSRASINNTLLVVCALYIILYAMRHVCSLASSWMCELV